MQVKKLRRYELSDTKLQEVSDWARLRSHCSRALDAWVSFCVCCWFWRFWLDVQALECVCLFVHLCVCLFVHVCAKCVCLFICVLSVFVNFNVKWVCLFISVLCLLVHFCVVRLLISALCLCVHFCSKCVWLLISVLSVFVYKFMCHICLLVNVCVECVCLFPC